MHRQYAQYEITASHASSHVHLLLIFARHTVHMDCSQHDKVVDARQHSSLGQYSWEQMGHVVVDDILSLIAISMYLARGIGAA